MTYTVVWLPGAEVALAQLWIDASQRNVISAASREIDRMLRILPNRLGESREGRRRVLFVRPLGVIYWVSDEDRVVTIVDVWRFES